jgi:hypothetical protein
LRLSYPALRRVAGSFLARLCDKDLPRQHWQRWRTTLSRPNFAYAAFDAYFERLPNAVKEHRAYFEQDRRGYGERAFHVLWYSISTQFDIARFLEIGVYRGQVLSLIALLQKQWGKRQQVTGISPFTDTGDDESVYPDLDFESDIRTHFRHFELASPTLVRASSTDGLAEQVIADTQWDCVYIDGSHDYEVVKHDWEVCSKAVREGGLLVLDDAGLYTSFKAFHDYYPFRGHEGPSRVAKEVDRTRFQPILQVGHNIVFRKIPVGNDPVQQRT